MNWTLLINLPGLLKSSFSPQKNGAYPGFSLQRIVVMLVFWPLFLTVCSINQLGLLLDNLLFPSFRHTKIHNPLFVLGIPRSGTTFLHRLLATDETQFTTMRLWELLFAPSITQRYFWTFWGRLDQRIGAPVTRLLNWLQSLCLSSLNDVHKTQLKEPEEDYFALAPILGCFLLVLPFGDSPLWKLSTFDRDASATEKASLMQFYHGIIQRHLYFHGTEKIFLSKNPSFTPLLYTLQQAFPDACFIACIRTPAEAVPSQVSAIMVGTKVFSGHVNHNWWQQKLINMLVFYYQQVLAAQQILTSDHYQLIRMEDLVANPKQTVTTLYHRFGYTLTAAHQTTLHREQEKSRQFRSKHHYNGERLGIHKHQLNQTFDFVYRELNYEPAC